MPGQAKDDQTAGAPENSLVREVKRVPVVDNHDAKKVDQSCLEVIGIEDPVVGL